MNFITSVYNESHQIFLGPLIQSISAIYGNSSMIIYYSNVSKTWVNLISKAYSGIRLRALDPDNLQGLHLILPSRKLNFWYEALKKESEKVIFLDADMLLIKNIDCYLEPDYDIGYTYKTDPDENLDWLLNTGIILVKNVKKARPFFKIWVDDVNLLIKDAEKKRLAGKEWGAPDQASLGRFLEIARPEDCINPITKKGLKFQGFKCKEINETRCRTLSEEIKIIHYKGKWHPILKGESYSEWRPPERCEEMFFLWNKFRKIFEQKIAEGLS